MNKIIMVSQHLAADLKSFFRYSRVVYFFRKHLKTKPKAIANFSGTNSFQNGSSMVGRDGRGIDGNVTKPSTTKF